MTAIQNIIALTLRIIFCSPTNLFWWRRTWKWCPMECHQQWTFSGRQPWLHSSF